MKENGTQVSVVDGRTAPKHAFTAVRANVSCLGNCILLKPVVRSFWKASHTDFHFLISL